MLTNAVRWTNRKGKGANVSAKTFCSILYESLNWDQGYAYRSPAIVRRRNGAKHPVIRLGQLHQQGEAHTRRPGSRRTGDRSGTPCEIRGNEELFFGADDEPQPVEDTEDMEQRLQELADYEKRNCSTPAFENNSDFRLTAIDDDGEWEVIADRIFHPPQGI